jgi:hypothetical protein
VTSFFAPFFLGRGRQGTEVLPPNDMHERWVYFMLLDRSGMTIGFSREGACVTHYADLRTDRWFREPILYADRVKLRRLPEGLRVLRGCR